MKNEKIMPSAKYAFLALGAIVLFMIVGINFLKVRIEVMMFLSWLIIVPFAKKLGYSFSELELAAYDMVRKGMQAISIILAVGMLVGAWISAGTVPTLIYYGLKVITPRFFLVTALILCSLVSLATGTSWGTMGTCGIAMMGIGAGLGIPAGMTAGAVISGAYFGDKLSPLSDSTNLAPAVSGTDVITHIKHMLYVTVPSYIITFIIFLFLGFRYGSDTADLSMIKEILNSLDGLYNIGIISLAPAILVIILLIRGQSPVTSILIGSATGFVVATLYQGFEPAYAAQALYTGFSGDFGSEFLNKLLNRGGLLSMANIASIMVSGLGLGGMLRHCGILQSILDVMAKKIKSVGGLVGSTMLVAYLANMIGGSMSFAAVMTGTLMSPLYEKWKLKPENLSRTIEDSSTLGAPLIPWNSNALFAMSMLQVSYGQYVGFAFFNFIDPVIALIFAYIGFSIKKYTDDELKDSSKAELA
ncbi:Na+/H+ antiporter NhaC [Maledivibacter halophilus]|uniref:Na+:H+ antiporter, NhaC family n=1 Tax=Maledivibacter halophilus TaxID=36842 RepID=A0A1T5K0Z7_9FIRM|nr:Na+/H+ antiporter NhaC [Maledivibacter halophilus]SKC57185.1 Na+:H+ antiporter, NhaC family [Maledivibacter halophilus]